MKYSIILRGTCRFGPMAILGGNYLGRETTEIILEEIEKERLKD